MILGAFTCLGAAAQTYDKLVSFGDSLSSINELVTDSSNGPVWVERLGFNNVQTYGGPITGNVDYAIPGGVSGPTTNWPGVQTEIANYFAAGGKLTPSSLVTIWTGTNDIGTLQSPTRDTVLAAAQAGASYAGQDVAQIIAAGGRSVVVLNVPAFTDTPAASFPYGDEGVAAFNSALAANLHNQMLLNPGVEIVEVDVAALYNEVHRNPSRFGFTDVVDQCEVGTNVCATPSNYFFWNYLHPTTAGHRLIAALVLEDLSEYQGYAKLAVPTAAESEAGLLVRSRSTQNVFLHLEELPYAPGGGALSFSAGGATASADSQNGGVMPAVLDHSGHADLTWDAPSSGPWRWGAKLGASLADDRAGLLGFQEASASGDLFVRWRYREWFVNAMAGADFNDLFHIQRDTSTMGLSNLASSRGWSGGGAIQAGFYIPVGTGAFSPRLGLAYTRSSVAGYTESGPMLKQAIGDHGVALTTGDAGLRFDTGRTHGVSGFFEAGYRVAIDSTADPVAVSIPESLRPVQYTGVGLPQYRGAHATAGLRWRLNGFSAFELDYAGQYGSGLRSHAVTLGLRFDR